jgi:hypothetical protein
MLLAAAGTALGLLVALWITSFCFRSALEGADTTGSAMREFDFPRLDLPVFSQPV